MDLAPVVTAEQVADLLEAVAAANDCMAAEAARIAGAQAAVTQATVDRLTRLADQLRPGANARAQLAELEPQLLLAGTALWLRRLRGEPSSAVQRAQQRWVRLSA